MSESNIPGPSRGRAAEYPQMDMQSIKREIDLESLVSKSLTALNMKDKTQSQLTLLVKVLEEKAVTVQTKIAENLENTEVVIHELDILDYFAAKDGLKYIGFLEQLQYNYENKCKAEIYNASAPILAKVDECKAKIQALSEFHYHNEGKELHDYDFPVHVEKILHHFPIDATRKLHEIAKYHNYGIKMVLHWVYVIQRRTRELDPQRMEAFAIELLADIMVPSYAIFIHFAEFIICMADAPPSIKEGYPVDDLIDYLRRFYDTLTVECSAIAESVGEVMVRIPNIHRENVIERMTKIYYAVNHCNFATCRVLDALGPMLLYYQAKLLLADVKDYSATQQVPDFKRFTPQAHPETKH